jgi:hypothetical protein
MTIDYALPMVKMNPHPRSPVFILDRRMPVGGFILTPQENLILKVFKKEKKVFENRRGPSLWITQLWIPNPFQTEPTHLERTQRAGALPLEGP